ncbi:unnamed protein product [Amoebophrya sp. A25]|nr:unnamed protein product [Amoebophrya sp. A25]|eukprot:GSA25T00016213001.1
MSSAHFVYPSSGENPWSRILSGDAARAWRRELQPVDVRHYSQARPRLFDSSDPREAVRLLRNKELSKDPRHICRRPGMDYDASQMFPPTLLENDNRSTSASNSTAKSTHMGAKRQQEIVVEGGNMGTNIRKDNGDKQTSSPTAASPTSIKPATSPGGGRRGDISTSPCPPTRSPPQVQQQKKSVVVLKPGELAASRAATAPFSSPTEKVDTVMASSSTTHAAVPVNATTLSLLSKNENDEQIETLNNNKSSAGAPGASPSSVRSSRPGASRVSQKQAMSRTAHEGFMGATKLGTEFGAGIHTKSRRPIISRAPSDPGLTTARQEEEELCLYRTGREDREWSQDVDHRWSRPRMTNYWTHECASRIAYHTLADFRKAVKVDGDLKIAGKNAGMTVPEYRQTMAYGQFSKVKRGAQSDMKEQLDEQNHYHWGNDKPFENDDVYYPDTNVSARRLTWSAADFGKPRDDWSRPGRLQAYQEQRGMPMAMNEMRSRRRDELEALKMQRLSKTQVFGDNCGDAYHPGKRYVRGEYELPKLWNHVESAASPPGKYFVNDIKMKMGNADTGLAAGLGSDYKSSFLAEYPPNDA